MNFRGVFALLSWENSKSMNDQWASHTSGCTNSVNCDGLTCAKAEMGPGQKAACYRTHRLQGTQWPWGSTGYCQVKRRQRGKG